MLVTCKQKIKCGTIRTRELTGIRLLDELYVNNKKVISLKSMKLNARTLLLLYFMLFSPHHISLFHLPLLQRKEALRKNLVYFFIIVPVFGNESTDA